MTKKPSVLKSLGRRKEGENVISTAGIRNDNIILIFIYPNNAKVLLPDIDHVSSMLHIQHSASFCLNIYFHFSLTYIII